jgi:hypothetical protein
MVHARHAAVQSDAWASFFKGVSKPFRASIQPYGVHNKSPEQARAENHNEHSSPSTVQAPSSGQATADTHDVCSSPSTMHVPNRHACHLLQRPVAGCLAAHCGAYKHEAMPNKCGLIQLDALGNKAVHCLQTHLLAGLRKSLQQIAIVYLRPIPQLGSLACLACASCNSCAYDATPSGIFLACLHHYHVRLV